MSGGDRSSSPPGRWTALRRGLRHERAWQVLAGAVVVGFVLRLAWVLYATREPVGYHDPTFYEHLAWDLANGRGYVGESGLPTAYYPPGYPMILSAIFALVLHTPLPDNLPMAGALMNLVFGTATILTVGLLGRRLVGPWVGAIAAIVVALFPSLILHTSLLLSETTFNFFLTATLLVLLWNPWRNPAPGRDRIVAVGMLTGLCVLIRPVALPVLVAFAVGLWLARAPWRVTCVRIGLLALGVVAVVAPWTARNAVAMDAFVPISTNTGDNLCIGNHDGAQGGFALPESCFEGVPPFPQDWGDVERNEETTRRALQWILDNPLEQPSLIWWRNYYTFVNDRDPIVESTSYGEDPWMSPRMVDVLGTTSDAYFFGISAVAAVGVVAMAGRRRPRRWTYLLTMVAMITATWWTFGDVRFHLPLNPLLAVPAAIVVAGVPLMRRQITSTGPGAGAPVTEPTRRGTRRAGDAGQVRDAPHPGDQGA